jgi:hypothetical protein
MAVNDGGIPPSRAKPLRASHHLPGKSAARRRKKAHYGLNIPEIVSWT